MAELLRDDNALLALRLRRPRGRHEAALEWDVFVGCQVIESGSVEFAESPRRRPGHLPKGPLASPEALTDAVVPVLLAMRQGDEAVWLQLPPRDVGLALVPWEPALVPALAGAPLLRIPHRAAYTAAPRGRVDVAVLFSQPRAKETWDSTVRALEHAKCLLDYLAREPGVDQVHLLADRRWRSDFSAGPDLHVHEADEDLESGVLGPLDSFGAESPWLRWMASELGEADVRAAHFVVPGFLRRGRAALAFAESPHTNRDRSWSHFVGAGDLAQQLTLLGVDTVTLHVPEAGRWSHGVRGVAHELAYLRPGGAMVAEGPDPGQGEHFDAAWPFLVWGGPQAPVVPEGAMYCHPLRLQERPAQDEDLLEGIGFDTRRYLHGGLRGGGGGADRQRGERWRRVLRMQIKSDELALSSRLHEGEATTPEDVGEQRALQFLAKLTEEA